MASRRSRSPSTPSEGEIIESGSETKATTSRFPLNGTSVDRHPRDSPSSASRSPASVRSRSPPPRRRGGSRTRSRTRSRSPYRDNRGFKRRRDDDYEDRDRRYRNDLPSRRAPGSGYRYDDGRYSDRSSASHRPPPPRSYHDYDRGDDYTDSLRYNDESDRRPEKRPRTRSRSPYREVRKPKQYSGDELEPLGEERVASQGARGRSSLEQSVSERRSTPVVARDSKQKAETKTNQVQQGSKYAPPAVEDRYVSSFPLLDIVVSY